MAYRQNRFIRGEAIVNVGFSYSPDSI